MNITAGNPVQRGVRLSDIGPRDYLMKLMQEKFNGYTCFTIRGRTGIEEGTLVLHNGNIVAANYEYYKYNRAFKADDALARALNALLADNGVVDSFSLSPNQVQLVMTLNEDCNLKQEITSRSSFEFPTSFSYAFEEELSGLKAPEKEYSREVLLRKYGLSRLAGKSASRAVLLEGADEEVKKVNKMMKKGKK